MMERKETWRKGIKITDMKKGDLIYIQKSRSGFSVMLECEFIKYEKGIVYAKVTAIPYPKWFSPDYPIGKLITARKKKCMLWGRDTPEGRAHCHWFKTVKMKECHNCHKKISVLKCFCPHCEVRQIEAYG